MSNESIERILGRLEGTITKGFEGVHQRLDTANGRLEKHDEKIGELERFDAEVEGAQKESQKRSTMVGGASGGIIGAVSSIIAYFIAKAIGQ